MCGEHQLSKETTSELERTASPELQSRFYSIALKNFFIFSCSKFSLYKVNITFQDFAVFFLRLNTDTFKLSIHGGRLDDDCDDHPLFPFEPGQL